MRTWMHVAIRFASPRWLRQRQDYSIKRNLERLELFIRREVLKSFRQWGSKTPGHPENFETPGVEVTTGPLGQGIANAVGLALAEKHLAARFNKPDNEIVDHYTSDVVVFWIIGDGCQMEGITNEVCSLAGHWGLGKLIAFYDDNHISIDGDTEIAFTENVDKRFEALGCHVIWVKNGNNGHDEIRKLIQCPRSEKEVEATRNNLGWPCEPFQVPEDVKSHWSRHTPEGAALEADWNAKFAAYEKKYPEEVEKLKSIISGNLPAGWEKALPTYTPESPGDATRNLSQQCLNALAKSVPGFLGGVLTLHSKTLHLKEETSAICNGIALHSPGFIPYCATFFVFTDYMRAAMRISALSEAGVIYVMTPDSIGLGEDGPTPQPIEHLSSFRAMPNIMMFRPADGNETAGAYRIARGGYTVSDNSNGNKPDVILIGTGLGIEIAAQAGEELRKEGKTVRVVSFVCWELFDEQTDAYKESVLPSDVTARVRKGKSVGVDSFGASAPAGKLYKEFGITVEAVVVAAKSLI
ncbi:hypothetical protein Bca52824_009107 [Brassica carinata]|uniref:Transketolase-like pyrimidine-binding domain-containing protein n=1 Tax=Brassica carinata TaxID=52824 RepID=A0A8X8B6L4_BRACI|nr:hypothetical protein Bca52824_009107 [Brassica carinata]